MKIEGKDIVYETTDIVGIRDTEEAGEFAGKEVELLKNLSSGMWAVEDSNGKKGIIQQKFIKTVRVYYTNSLKL